MLIRRYLILWLLMLAVNTQAQLPYSQQMTNTVMRLWKDSLPTGNKWTYDQGAILKGIEGVWRQTGDSIYFNFIKNSMDKFVQTDGSIKTYNFNDLTLDNILCGRNLLMLYKVTREQKYLKAVQILRNQLRHQPRTPEGGFWHKKVYPNQMWLDGLYMAEPFYAEYARTFHEDTAFKDIALQFELINEHARDPKTDLIYHGWDASHKQKWSNPQTGNSSNFWGRAMGWYGMALVDVLQQFPTNHPKYKVLLAILKDYCATITKYQDKSNGLWYEIVDKAHEKGNYPEASASCMFVYTIAKAVKENYINKKYLIVAKNGYEGIINKFITKDNNGLLSLEGTVQVGGLGGKPYRDGSYNYYLSEKVITNDAKGLGAFILACVEMENLLKNKNEWLPKKR